MRCGVTFTTKSGAPPEGFFEQAPELIFSVIHLSLADAIVSGRVYSPRSIRNWFLNILLWMPGAAKLYVLKQLTTIRLGR